MISFIGTQTIGNFIITITTPNFYKPSTYAVDETLNLPYYEVIVYEKFKVLNNKTYYSVINLHKDKRINFNFTKIRFDSDLEEIKSYDSRKELTAPFWKLNSKSINKLIKNLNDLTFTKQFKSKFR